MLGSWALQICWDGGELACCSSCPASYHAPCLGLSLQVRLDGQ
jgi:hypothetical protein